MSFAHQQLQHKIQRSCHLTPSLADLIARYDCRDLQIKTWFVFCQHLYTRPVRDLRINFYFFISAAGNDTDGVYEITTWNYSTLQQKCWLGLTLGFRLPFRMPASLNYHLSRTHPTWYAARS